MLESFKLLLIATPSSCELLTRFWQSIPSFPCSPFCAVGCRLSTTSKKQVEPEPAPKVELPAELPTDARSTQVEPAPKVELPVELPADTVKVREVDGKEQRAADDKAVKPEDTNKPVVPAVLPTDLPIDNFEKHTGGKCRRQDRRYNHRQDCRHHH